MSSAVQFDGAVPPVSRPGGEAAPPVVDLQLLEEALASSGSAKTAACESLKQVLLHDGFLFLTNTGHDVDECAAKVRAVTTPVMDLPAAETEALVSQGFPPKGLTRCNGESTATVVGKGNYSDICAKWTLTSGDDNVFPAGDDGTFKSAWEGAFAAWDAIAIRLLKAIGQALDLTGDEHWCHLTEAKSREAFLRFLHYPDVPHERAADVAAQPERMAAHHDLDVITVLHQTPCANGFVSLQAYIGDKWIDVPAMPGAVVVNFGEALSIITAGAVKSTTHRVVSPPSSKIEGSARESLVLFWEPPPSYVIKPLSDTFFAEYNKATEGLPFGEWLMAAASSLQAKNGSAKAGA